MKILILILILFSILLFLNVYKYYQQSKRFKTKLALHNKDIIFINNSDINLKLECFQPESFFLMSNDGQDPCQDTNPFEYIRYASNEDCYLLREQEG